MAGQALNADIFIRGAGSVFDAIIIVIVIGHCRPRHSFPLCALIYSFYASSSNCGSSAVRWEAEEEVVPSNDTKNSQQLTCL